MEIKYIKQQQNKGLGQKKENLAVVLTFLLEQLFSSFTLLRKTRYVLKKNKNKKLNTTTED